MNLDGQIQSSLNKWLGSEYDSDTRSKIQELIDSNNEKQLLMPFTKSLNLEPVVCAE